MSAEELEGTDEERGVPAWVMTFADLMTLLMCFFVLMLSFSEMDVNKFKQLAGSLKNAFGVQAEIEARTIPKGTSVIAREFSPGKPEPTVLNSVRQMTIDSNRNTLDFTDSDIIDEIERQRREAEEDARRLRDALAAEIERGSVQVRTMGTRVIIRILEQGSFRSGDDQVRPVFMPVLERIREHLVAMTGRVEISGHSDALPISTERFRSNWDLSAARAASVAHVLMADGGVPAQRVVISGHADTRPVGDNATEEGRARNRRVDVTLVRGNDEELDAAELAFNEEAG